MSAPVDRPSVAADARTDPSEGDAAIDALARVLDPQAFELSEHPRNVGFELQRADRMRSVVVHAVRAMAAGYRLVSEEPVESVVEEGARRVGPWGCACESCLACTGDCPRCGQRDREPGLSLCAQCDAELEAEFGGSL